jgi:type II secretory pathway pseudopilin PulG
VKKFQYSVFFTRTLLLVIIFTVMLAFSAIAAIEKQTILSQKQETTLPLTVFDNYGKRTNDKAVFRTDGDYEWKWTIPSIAFLTYPIDSSGVYFKDHSNINYAVNSRGEKTWTFNEDRDAVLQKLQFGRFMSVVIDDKSTVQIEGEEEINYAFPSTAVVYDFAGTELFTLSSLNSNSPFTSDI